ncbi:hypothetical protein [Macrococcoides caseolyticum]|uniref:hypothetical protein n=1 Tax=Macrococcoides caseolyticum TaxID=69966 RepID=UPI00105C9B99|nr:MULTISPECIES: hypothetical protein [Macrococcus]MDJ1089983.1 hypothetical protein [Macrococcus caseolyticus]TDM39419.1 hypothetical protein ETI08_13520 [Macrococcus goetzii]
MKNKINKIILSTAILSTSLYGYTELNHPNVALAASCSNVKGDLITVKIPKWALVTTAAALAYASAQTGGLAGGTGAGLSTVISSGNGATIRQFNAYCTRNGKLNLKRTTYIYNASNTKKLKGPYTSYIVISGKGAGGVK